MRKRATLDNGWGDRIGNYAKYPYPNEISAQKGSVIQFRFGLHWYGFQYCVCIHRWNTCTLKRPKRPIDRDRGAKERHTNTPMATPIHLPHISWNPQTCSMHTISINQICTLTQTRISKWNEILCASNGMRRKQSPPNMVNGTHRKRNTITGHLNCSHELNIFLDLVVFVYFISFVGCLLPAFDSLPNACFIVMTLERK